MFVKKFSTNVILTVILFILVHVNESIHFKKHNRINPKTLLKYDDAKFSLWRHKKTIYQYKDPCETESSTVTTESLDPSTSSCSNCGYFPSTLTQVMCRRYSINELNIRDKKACKYNIPDGDCLNITATITVLKVFYTNNVQVYQNVTLTVGCACKILD